jgi:branched-chain amino acid aminotransferase
MKAYVDTKGRARLFRPEMNMARLAGSMQSLALPPLDEAGWLESIKQLVRCEKSWIPEGDGFSLYLRPTVIGTQPTLGVSPSSSCKLFTICCPVGPYYPTGFKPVRLIAETKAVRAWPGGTGNSKLGGNYAPTIRVQVAAAALGYSQVLWLTGPEQTVTEVGTMNFFVLWKRPDGGKELITAPLDGTILPGVTRDSLIQLARGWGEFDVVEKHFTMPQLAQAISEGRVLEMFGTGTAAVVAPVKQLHYEGKDYDVHVDPVHGAGEVARRLWNELAAIQYGRKDHEWAVLL